MDEQDEERSRLISAAREWARKDPCDPYKEILVEAVMLCDPQEGEIALRNEMKRNP